MTAFTSYLDSSIAVLEAARHAIGEATVERAVAATTAALAADKPLLICGNGGSATDAMHIAGELVGRFLAERRALKAIALSADSAILTAWANDYSYDEVFARQVDAYGEPGGVLLAISTSGNSANVLAAAKAAKAKRMTVIALTGEGGGKLGPLADILLAVPSRATPFIQQVHICIYHYLCGEIEQRIAGAGPR
ncbi:MAG TPA: SIS domain-containing protein [Stellaceae bacterium]|jgi:D-sedoheptulose 7-phosphate isomerase|nr:SIS domain-containing protein [Stellaceae bacterium]